MNNLHSQCSNQFECDKDKAWIKQENTTNLSSAQMESMSTLKLWESKEPSVLLSTLKLFLVLNLKTALQEIHQYFQKNNLPDIEKQNLIKELKSGETKFLKIVSEITEDSSGQLSFRMSFKSKKGFSDSPLNFRCEFDAYCYPDISDFIYITFLRIGPRKEFYHKDESMNNLHSQCSNQLECGKDREWKTIKESLKLLKKCQNQSVQKYTIMESLSGTLSNFVVVNQQEMIPVINQFFMEHKNVLSEKLKNQLNNILYSGDLKYIGQYGDIPKFDKQHGSREFEVKLKFQDGQTEDSIRLILHAFEFEVSDTLILEFKKINFREMVYKKEDCYFSESLNEMRTKILKINGKDVEAVLMAGGFGAKIYSAGEDIVLVKGRKQTVIPDTDPKYKTIINYVNLKYMPVNLQKEITDNFKNLLSEEMASLMLPERLPNYRTLQGYPKKKKVERLEANDPSLIHLSKIFEEFLVQVKQIHHQGVDKISVIEKYYFPKSKSVAADIEVKYKDGEEHVYHIDYNGINFSWIDFGINVDLGDDVQEAILSFKIMLDEKVPHKELVKK